MAKPYHAAAAGVLVAVCGFFACVGIIHHHAAAVRPTALESSLIDLQPSGFEKVGKVSLNWQRSKPKILRMVYEMKTCIDAATSVDQGVRLLHRFHVALRPEWLQADGVRETRSGHHVSTPAIWLEVDGVNPENRQLAFLNIEGWGQVRRRLPFPAAQATGAEVDAGVL